MHSLLLFQWFHKNVKMHSHVTLTLNQCTLTGPVYTGMPTGCHWLTQYTLEYHRATQRVYARYIGTPREKVR